MLAILTVSWIILSLSRLFVPITIVFRVSLLSAISNWNIGLEPTRSLKEGDSSLTAKEQSLVVFSSCMLTTQPSRRRTPNLTLQLDAAQESIASMTFRIAMLAEEKDDALTRANTLENVKESWAVRERALVSTIKGLRSSHKLPCDVAGLRTRLQETESMLAHQISVRTKLEDELVRYREIAHSHQDELYTLRKESAKRMHEQAVEIATLKGQLLAMEERERQLTLPPTSRKTFRFWKKRQVVKVDLGISSSSVSSSAFKYY